MVAYNWSDTSICLELSTLDGSGRRVALNTKTMEHTIQAQLGGEWFDGLICRVRVVCRVMAHRSLTLGLDWCIGRNICLGFGDWPLPLLIIILPGRDNYVKTVSC